MSELSRTQTPPGGWQFYQPQTKWSAPTPIASTFDQTVILIIKHRLANGAITVRNNLATDPVSVGNELEAFTRARLGLGPAIAPKLSPPPPVAPALAGPVAGAVAAVKKIAAGAALLLEWEESGLPPVPAELSVKRAATCEGCPKNDPGGLSKYFTEPVSEKVQKRLGRLHQMNLATPSDAKLHVCSACLCPLKLKVHCPMELIQKRLKPEQRAELDPRCWILANQ